MNFGDLLTGISSILSGISKVKSGLDGLSLFEPRKKIMALSEYRGDGSQPVATSHRVGSNVEERVKYIKDMAVKGARDPSIRAWTVALLSSKVGTCRYCHKKNFFSRVENYCPADFVVSKLEDGKWQCGNCKRSNSVDGNSIHWYVPEKSHKAEVVTVFEAVRSHVRYTRDIANIDTYQHPKRTLEFGGGDCDDYTSLLIAMLLAVGYEPKIQTMETKDATGKRANGWNHILVLVGLPPKAPQGFMPLDASLDRPAGWYPPKGMIYRTKDFGVEL